VSGNARGRYGVIRGMSDHNDAGAGTAPARLVLVEQSGAKQEIPQPSTAQAMVEAEQAMHDHGSHLREIKVISQHTAIARWKAGEPSWRRVA
jgi:hypothetical protein